MGRIVPDGVRAGHANYRMIVHNKKTKVLYRLDEETPLSMSIWSPAAGRIFKRHSTTASCGLDDDVRAAERSFPNKTLNLRYKEPCFRPIAIRRVVFHLQRSAIIALDSRHRTAPRAVTIAELQASPANARRETGGASVLSVAQWIVHMPPKRGILVRFQSEGPVLRLSARYSFLRVFPRGRCACSFRRGALPVSSHRWNRPAPRRRPRSTTPAPR